MRIFVHLKDGNTIIKEDATDIRTTKDKLVLKDKKGYSLYTTELGTVHLVEILPELWKI